VPFRQICVIRESGVCDIVRRAFAGNRAKQGALLYGGDKTYSREGVTITSWRKDPFPLTGLFQAVSYFIEFFLYEHLCF
jgi:hypothetical protein